MTAAEPNQLLFAARAGELCARAGEGVAPDWEFLDAWLQLIGTDAGCLVLRDRAGAERIVARGITPNPVPAEADGVTREELDGLSRLRIACRAPTGEAATLEHPLEAEAHLALTTALLPSIRRGLLRLAVGAESPDSAAAWKAWQGAPSPMLLLDSDLSIIANNPAAQRAGLTPSAPAPPWLRRWLDHELGEEGGGPGARWTTHVGDVEHHLSVVSVAAAEPTPGAWLVSIQRGGPTLDTRILRAKERWALSPREAETLELLAEGLSNRRIGDALSVSESTVKFHLVAVMRKVGAANRTELLARLHRLHLVDPDQIVPVDSFRLAASHAFVDGEGILQWIHDQGAEVSGRDVEEFFELARTTAGDGTIRIYSDATGIVSTDRAAFKAAGGSHPFIHAAAIRGGSAVSRAITNLWLRVSSPKYPTRLFRDRGPAFDFLRSHR